MKRFLFPRSGSERAAFDRPSLFWAIAGTGSALVATAFASLISVPDTAEAVLRSSDRCDAVGILQGKLSDKGYSAGPQDNIFGSQTERAVLRFQQDDQALEPTGQASEATLSALGLSADLACNGVTHQVATQGGVLRLRSQPSTNSTILDYLSNSTSVKVVRESGGWSQLEQGGWVSGNYLARIDSSNPGSGSQGGGGGQLTPIAPPKTVLGVPGSLDVSQNTAPSPATFGVARCPHVATVRSSGSLYVYDNPNGAPLGTAREGRELCLSGRGTISDKQMWTELISGNWVDSGNIKITK